MRQRYDVRTSSQSGAGRRRWLLCVAMATALGAAAATAAPEPTPAPVQSTTSTRASRASGATPCSYTESAAAALGKRLLDIVRAEVAESYTDQFRDLRAVLVSVCGKLVLQHYEKTTPAKYYTVASVTKIVVGTLVGVALADGSLRDLNQTLAELLPERRKDMTAEVAAIALRQLLTMTAGLDADSTDDSVKSW